MVLTSLRFLCCSDRFSFILLFEYLAVKCFDNSFLYFWWCYFNIRLHCSFMSLSLQQSRHFSHVTKSGIFKNLNLRKKADRNFRSTFLKNRFRDLKLYSNPSRWLARSRCHMGKDKRKKFILKDKRLKFTFLTFQVSVRGSSPPKKT